jgi:phosphoglycolate phosphatase-like HAD superfamily hydrolase
VTWGTHPRAELLTAGFDALIDHPEQLPGLLAGWT